MKDDTIDRIFILIIPLKPLSPDIPQLDGPIFRPSINKIGIFLEPNGRDITFIVMKLIDLNGSFTIFFFP